MRYPPHQQWRSLLRLLVYNWVIQPSQSNKNDDYGEAISTLRGEYQARCDQSVPTIGLLLVTIRLRHQSED